VDPLGVAETLAGAEFQEEFLDVIDERLLDLGLASGIGGAEEVEGVGVFEKLGGHVRIRRGYGESEVILGLAGAEADQDGSGFRGSRGSILHGGIVECRTRGWRGL